MALYPAAIHARRVQTVTAPQSDPPDTLPPTSTPAPLPEPTVHHRAAVLTTTDLPDANVWITDAIATPWLHRYGHEAGTSSTPQPDEHAGAHGDSRTD